MEDTISDAERLITKWKYNRVSATSPPVFLFLTNSQEAKEYIERVHELRRIMDFYVSTHTGSPNIALAHNLIQSAMQRLEMEFHHLLSVNNEYFNATLTSSDEGADYDTVANSFSDDLKMIAHWIHAMFLSMGRLFNNERTLCDHIFSGASDALGESSFDISVTRHALSHSRGHSRYQIHLLLRIHITSPTTSTQLTGGGIHILSQSSMDQITRLADYTAILSTIITDHPSPADKTWMPESYFNTSTASPESPISIRFARLILVLLCKLDKIAETYKDISLSYLFLSNNLHFIVSKVRNAQNLLNLIGEGWIITHYKTAKQYALKYEFTSWHKVIKSITLEEDEVPNSASAQSRLRKFRSELDEAITKQRTWTVVNGRMREDLKASISRRVVSAYSEFYEASVGVLDKLDVERFGAEEIESCINELFEGYPLSGGSLSGSSSSSSSFSSSSSSASASPVRRFFNRLPNKSRLNDTLSVV